MTPSTRLSTIARRVTDPAHVTITTATPGSTTLTIHHDLFTGDATIHLTHDDRGGHH